MTIFKKFGAFTATIVLLAYSLLLVLTPKQLNLEQKSHFNAPPQMIFPYVAKPRLWEQWTVWSPTHDTTLTYSFGGPPVGPGMWLAWSSQHTGEQKVLIQTYQSPTTMTYEWQGWPGRRPWRGSFHLQTTGDYRTAISATVTWRVDADLGWDPIARLRGPSAAKRLQQQMATGLSALRQQLENEWAQKQRRRQEQLQRHIEQTKDTAE